MPILATILAFCRMAAVVVFWFVLLLVILIVGGCGGGGSMPDSGGSVPTPQIQPTPVRNFLDYTPLRASVDRLANSGPYRSRVGPGVLELIWGASTVEEFRVQRYAGEDWLFLVAFRDDTARTRYPIVTTRIDIDRNDGRGWQSLPPVDGNPYAPLAVPGGFSLRLWGFIAGDYPFFWQQSIEPVPAIYNACWIGAGDSQRDVLRQREAWHDPTGWSDRGSGNVVDGKPDGTGITYSWHQDMARDAGHLWQGSGGTCLIH